MKGEKMARKRMIDPGIWQSEDFGKLSNLAKIVFIGLFSLADDEGRGRANPTYLKSSLFPYNEDMRSADIEKALFEISSNMSVVFYSCDESSYYSLLSWDVFQKIDKPKESIIPAFDKNNKEIRLLFDEQSTTNSRKVAPNRIEKNKNRIEKESKKFIPPTLEEIQEYVLDKKLKVDAKQFFDYFEAGKWIDSKGQPVRSWKQKILTWNGYSKTKKEEPKTSFSQREYKNLDRFYTNV